MKKNRNKHITQEQFTELIKSIKPVKIEYQPYGDVLITFDDKTKIEIGIYENYDTPELQFVIINHDPLKTPLLGLH